MRVGSPRRLERGDGGPRPRCPAWARRCAAVAIPLAAVLYLLSAPVIGAPLDDEDYRNAVLSSMLHARALAEGAFPAWSSALALGLPQPLYPALLLHPLTPLFAYLPPEQVVRLLYVCHALAGALGTWWLTRYLGVGAVLSGVASATWALSTPTLQYAVTDFWLSSYVGWSLFPALVVLTLRVLDRSGTAQSWPDAIGLGCVSGFIFANGHAGHTSVIGVALGVWLLIELRLVRRALPALLVSAVIGGVIGAPSILTLVQELDRFPDVPRVPADSELGLGVLLDAPLRPFVSLDPSGWMPGVERAGTRVPFFGGPLLIAGLCGALGLARGLSRRPALTGALLASAALMAAPPSWGLEAMAGTFLFRDPVVLFGLVLGVMVLQAWARHRPILVAALAAAQLLVLVVAAWPFIAQAWRNGPGIERTFLNDTPTTRALRAWVPRLPGRWYVAPALDERVQRGFLEEAGLAPDAWFYRALPVINGTFKGVSMDAFYPSRTLPIGRIRGEAATVASASTLSVMGVGAVLAIDEEPVAPSLEEVATFPVPDGRIRLLRNPRAWPGAAFVDPAALAAVPPLLADCGHRGLLCRDFTALVAQAPGAPVELTRSEGQVMARFDPVAQVRWIIVAEAYRPGWTARSSHGTPLRLEPAWDALIAVEVPAGVSRVELAFRPAMMIASTVIAVFVLVLSAAWWSWCLLRSGRDA